MRLVAKASSQRRRGRAPSCRTLQVQAPTTLHCSLTLQGLITPGYSSEQNYVYAETWKSQTFLTASGWQQISINGDRTFEGVLPTWNTGSSVFHPEFPYARYMIRFCFCVEPNKDSPVFCVAMVASGTNPNDSNASHRHIQQRSFNTINGVKLHHAFTNVIVTDPTYYVSGVIFLASCFGANSEAVTMMSASVGFTIF